MADELATLLERRPDPGEAIRTAAIAAGVAAFTAQAPCCAGLLGADARRNVEAVIGEIDRRLSEQINLVLHHPDFQLVEATWRGLHFLVIGAAPDGSLKIRALDVSKRELVRTLKKFRGTAWDQSPIFKRIYEEEYGQFGGEPYGVLIGDYAFDHRPEDVALLSDLAAIAAAAHAPFIAAAAPAVMQMDSWAELANPRDLTRIFQTPEYAPWRALRASEDARYLGLCLPRFLGRLPYGALGDPAEAFDFEEDVEGGDAGRYLWVNAAYAMGANIARAFSLYGWCVRIRGVDGGGAVDGLPVITFPTADGETDRRCPTEVALSERREAELAQSGFIPLVYRKNTDYAAFISAQSLQRPTEYEDPAATANAALAARLPYLFASCRFAHYLKCMVRDKVGSSLGRAQITQWLQRWLRDYIDGAPERSSEEWKAAHPLVEARVTLDEKEDAPGQYDARFFLRPHYQLEGMTAVLRLISRLPAT
ncbi:MAG: type VI secretion system contractile sheath large subunit [Alphaproteobacteria bacterium]|nr:type VI secretion system contractile sheath large subunit [Alphaproteobacteria bacterium]